MAENGWPPFTAINKTSNSTGRMGEGDVAGVPQGEKVNKKNPYGAGPEMGNSRPGGKPSNSQES